VKRYGHSGRVSAKRVSKYAGRQSANALRAPIYLRIRQQRTPSTGKQVGDATRFQVLAGACFCYLEQREIAACTCRAVFEFNGRPSDLPRVIEALRGAPWNASDVYLGTGGTSYCKYCPD
jgi:hypothetical protein